MKTFRTWWRVAAVLSLAACSDAQTNAKKTALNTLTCPAGQVPFNFSKFTSPMTTEGISSLAPDDKYPKVNRQPNVITIQSATCNVGFDWKSILGEFCDGRERCVINRQDCSGALQWSYTCSATPNDVQRNICYGSYDCVGDLICPQPAPTVTSPVVEDKVSCVPEKCSITQRRDKDLNCVEAPERPVELANYVEDHYPDYPWDDEYVPNSVVISEMSSPYPAFGVRKNQGGVKVADFDYRGIWPFSGGPNDSQSFPYFQSMTNELAGRYRLLFAGSLYNMQGTYFFADTANVPVEQKTRKGTVTLYIVDEYGLPQQDPSGATVLSVTDTAVRCVLHEFELSKTTPVQIEGRTDRYKVLFSESVVVPRDCEEGGPIWSENVKVLARKHNKTAVDFLNSYHLIRSSLRAAYDIEGRTTLLSQKPDEAATACNPNPIDMFYNSTLETHDRVAYFGQRSIPMGFAFSRWDASGSAPETAEGLRVSQGGMHVRGATKTTVGVTDIRPKKVEFKFKSASKVRQFFRADVDWFMSGDDHDFWKNQGLTGEVRAKLDLSLVPVNADNTPRYADALPLGPSPLLTSTPAGETQAMRFEVTKEVKDRFMDESGPYFASETGTPYVLRSCISLVKLVSGAETPLPKFNGKSQLVAYLATEGLKLTIEPGEFGQERLEVLDDYVCTTSAMPIVVKLDPSITPVPADEAGEFADSDPQAAGDARVSQNYDQDNDRRCVKAMVDGKNGEHCDSRTISNLGGSTAATVLRTEVSSNDKGADVVVTKEAELMGLQVFDEEEDKPFAFSSNRANVTVTVAPSFDRIKDAINAANTGNGVEAEEEHFSVGVSGLGLALSIKLPLRYGPVQGVIIFEISAGVGVGAELSFTQERETISKCTDGTSNCDARYTVATTPLPFRAARAACLADGGGRLVDLRDSAESTRLRGKLAANQDYWIGAQVANEYMKGCADLAKIATPAARAVFASQCMSQHKTHLRWLSNDEDFATRTGNGNFIADLTQIQPGTPDLTLRGTALELPRERGVSLSSTGLMDTPEMTTSLLYVCKTADSNYAVKNEAQTKIVLAAAAGMKLAFCTPSDEMGVCIEGSLNFIEATLVPSITYAHVGVGDTSSGAYISRSNVKLGLEFGLTALNGGVDAKIVFSVGLFDFELKYNIVEFSGFKIPTGDPLEKEFPLTGEPQ